MLRRRRPLVLKRREMLRAVKEARWEFLVLLPLFDPPRHDTKHTIEECIKKGISVKMVTGDQLLIGKETAKQLGMGTNMYTTELLLSVRNPPLLSGPWCMLSAPAPSLHCIQRMPCPVLCGGACHLALRMLWA
jgi:hypothetical protein